MSNVNDSNSFSSDGEMLDFALGAEMIGPRQNPVFPPVQSIDIYANEKKLKWGESLYMLPKERVTLTVKASLDGAINGKPYWDFGFDNNIINLIGFSQWSDAKIIEAVEIGSTHISVITNDALILLEIIVTDRIPGMNSYIHYHTSDPYLQRKSFAQTVFIHNVNVTNTGHKFSGWSTQKGSGVVAYNCGEPYNNEKTLDLYPVWEPEKYIITYKMDKMYVAPLPQEATYGKTIKIRSDTFKRDNYIFKGWTDSLSSSPYIYKSGKATYFTSNTTLYPVWEPINIAITFDANGGEGAPDQQSFKYNVKNSLSLTTPKRDNYTFYRWSKNKEEPGTLFKPGGEYAFDAPTTLYAVWRINKGGVLADLDSQWYSYDFTKAHKPECAWYVIGRIGEIYGVKIDFNSIIGTDGKTYRGSGGWWVKNAKEKANIATLNEDGTEMTIDKDNHKNITVITEPSEFNIKSRSAACFLFYVDISNAVGYHGHIQFIERAEWDENGIMQVSFSDSNSNVRASGGIYTLPYDDFIAQYNDSKAYNNEPIFQGFIQFD